MLRIRWGRSLGTRGHFGDARGMGGVGWVGAGVVLGTQWHLSQRLAQEVTRERGRAEAAEQALRGLSHAATRYGGGDGDYGGRWGGPSVTVAVSQVGCGGDTL